ncbi:YihY/virulence factor BrkB family protein [Gorillibacterium sp. sgz5001074]|uniref:YihY/virulence factor BrkB family protein n=1 Tax=Gorillibacterium sp. sgz5001074 TaxID=3446695 RepID=UPI003F67F2CD
MWKRLIRFLEDLYCRYEDDEVAALGAQMTYYLILSFFPFLIVLLTLAGLTPLSEEEVWSNLAVMLPEATFLVISDIIRQIVKERNDALLSFGMLATLWAASNGLNAIVKGLNKAYDEQETRPWWRVRAISVVYTLAVVLVLMITIALLVFGHLLGKQMFRQWAFPATFETVWDAVKLAVTVSIAFLVFMLLYRNAPNRRLSFRSVLPGAGFASVSWVGISLAFAAYVNHFNTYAKTYGSIGGVIVLLVWLYLSSTIILIGGEINAVLIFNKEGRRKPKCKSFSNRVMFWRKES